MQTHLIIGAGPCGLATAKALSEHKIPFVVAEADSDVGGNWLHGVYPTAHIISSKKITEYPDWPMPDDYPDFPSATQMCAYYQEYARSHKLYDHIHFNTKVLAVEPIENNEWRVTFEDGRIENFGGVVLCNGHHWDANWPSFPGTFDGEFIHSKYYKDTEQLRDKTTVVIGAGNSACDLASESARLGKQTYLAMRSGIYFIPKTLGGKPTADSPLAKWPTWIQRFFITKLLKFVQGDYYEDYGLKKPDYPLFDKHPTVNSEVLHYIKHGRIVPKGNVKAFAGREVIFEDNSRVEADLVVAATGYKLSYPFLPESLQRVEGHAVRALGQACLPDYRGLYFMGWQQFRGGVGQVFTPLGELLARYIKLQDEMGVPTGRFLQHIGDTPPKTHLMNPYALIGSVQKRIDRFTSLRKKALAYDKSQPAVSNRPLSREPVTEMVLY